jgi:hypothetical protein
LPLATTIHHGKHWKMATQVPALRHYSTIGIGDVFADKPPCVLPSNYLDHLPEIRSSSGNFLSGEIVGAVKSSPADFIVREIGLKGRHIPGLSEEEVEALRVAHLVSVDPDIPVVAVSSRSQDHPPESQGQYLANPAATTPTPSDQAKSATEKNSEANGNPSYDISPLEVILAILAQAVSSSTINEKANGQSAVDITILDELRKLELQALDQIEHMSRGISLPQSQPPANGISSANLIPQDIVFVPALSSNGDKGAFHRALRLAFPVLRADVVTVDPQSICSLPSSSKSQEIQVGVDETFFGLIPYLYEPRVDLPPGQTSLAADMEDIVIDDDRFMSFCTKFKYQGSYFVPDLDDTADITERISQARRLFGSDKGQLQEWMPVARDRSAWGRKAEYKLDLPPGSFTNLRKH